MIEIVEAHRAALTAWSISDTIVVSAGKTLKLETTPTGVDLVDSTVPAGKKWTVGIHIFIEETDA